MKSDDNIAYGRDYVPYEPMATRDEVLRLEARVDTLHELLVMLCERMDKSDELMNILVAVMERIDPPEAT